MVPGLFALTLLQRTAHEEANVGILMAMPGDVGMGRELGGMENETAEVSLAERFAMELIFVRGSIPFAPLVGAQGYYTVFERKRYRLPNDRRRHNSTSAGNTEKGRRSEQNFAALP